MSHISLTDEWLGIEEDFNEEPPQYSLRVSMIEALDGALSGIFSMSNAYDVTSQQTGQVTGRRNGQEVTLMLISDLVRQPPKVFAGDLSSDGLTIEGEGTDILALCDRRLELRRPAKSAYIADTYDLTVFRA